MNLTFLEAKILGTIAAVVFLFGGGYYEGWKSNHEQLIALASDAKTQNNEAKQKDFEHEKQTRALQKSYADSVRSLDDALDRLHNDSTGKLPQGSSSSQVIDGYTAVEGGTCKSSFFDKAMKAELLAEKWQEWAIRQSIPVAD